MNILLVDDHRLFVEGIKQVLMKYSSDVNVTQSFSGKNALDILDKHKKDNKQPYTLILVDISMPGIDGFDFLKAIKSRNILSPVIILTASVRPKLIDKAMTLGASGFIPKTISPESMIQGISQVLKGDVYLPEEYYDGTLLSNRQPIYNCNSNINSDLSPRLLEVLELIQKGHSNIEIATILNITEATVKSHLQILYEKFGVKRRTACVHEAIKQGILFNAE